MGISISEAEHQREGVLHLDVVVKEPNMTYQATAVVPTAPPDQIAPDQITIVSRSRRFPPQEEIKIAVLEYLRQTEDG